MEEGELELCTGALSRKQQLHGKLELYLSPYCSQKPIGAKGKQGIHWTELLKADTVFQS